MKISARLRPLKKVLILSAIFIANVLAQYYYTSLDLTEEKRFTLTEATKHLLKKLPDVVLVRVLLDGEFPAGFKVLQQGIKDLLDQFKKESPYIEYYFEDPSSGSIQEINKAREALAKEGIYPTNLMIKSGSENKEKLIYPYAILNYGERKIALNLLENIPDLDQETNISNSIALLEYKFANGIEKLFRSSKKNILFTTGNGELSPENTKTIEALLRPFYNLGRIHLDSHYTIKADVDLLLVARPTRPFSERSKFLLDQYIMNGGKVIWMVDGMQMALDSMMPSGEFVPKPLKLNLDDLLFKYGVRIAHNLVLDLECARIPQVIGKVGDKPQIEFFPWYYHPIPAPISDHPIVNNIDRILLEFPSSIDTLKTKYPVSKIPLIQTSRYSRYQLSPVEVDFDILRFKPDPSKFDKPNQIIAVLLEGKFASIYENRLEESMMKALKSLNMEFKSSSANNKMIVVADGDLIKNYYDERASKYSNLGYNKYDKSTYGGNKEFILNAIEYLIQSENILSARSKNIKLRLLDQVKIQRDKTFWQLLNIALPLAAMVLFGLVNQWWRKRKYTL